MCMKDQYGTAYWKTFKDIGFQYDQFFKENWMVTHFRTRETKGSLLGIIPVGNQERLQSERPDSMRICISNGLNIVEKNHENVSMKIAQTRSQDPRELPRKQWYFRQNKYGYKNLSLGQGSAMKKHNA